jgi:hypothetical protein
LGQYVLTKDIKIALPPETRICFRGGPVTEGVEASKASDVETMAAIGVGGFRIALGLEPVSVASGFEVVRNKNNTFTCHRLASYHFRDVTQVYGSKMRSCADLAHSQGSEI